MSTKHDCNVLNTVSFDEPYKFQYVYHDGIKHTFYNIIRLNTMQTGCYVLHEASGITYVVRPTHDFVIQTPMSMLAF